MADWQITAKTIFCEAVDDEVTILVQKSGAVRCTGCRKYGQPNDITRTLINQKTRQLNRSIKCEGEGCLRVSEYKNQILAEKQ